MTKQPNPEETDSTNPEWTVESFQRAKPAGEVLTALFGPTQAEEILKPKRRTSESYEADAYQDV